MNELDEIVWVGDAAVEELDCGSVVVAVLWSNGNGFGIEKQRIVSLLSWKHEWMGVIYSPRGTICVNYVMNAVI